MARSHGAKRHFNDFPGSSQGDESDGYLSVTLQFPRSRYSHDQKRYRMSPPVSEFELKDQAPSGRVKCGGCRD